MTRKPIIETPPAYTKRTSDRIVMRRNYSLITPMFGGGVTQRYYDIFTPIRGSSIRGELRFWWRATRGGQFEGSLDKMRKAEEAILGCAAVQGKPVGPSAVIISVKCNSKTEIIPTLSLRPNSQINSEIHEYVGFPLRPENVDGNRRSNVDAKMLSTAEFELQLTFPTSVTVGGIALNVKDELEAALWAWETFGGICARTRRGFGAIFCKTADNRTGDHPVDPNSAKKWIQDRLNKYIQKSDFPKEVPHLDSKMVFKCVSYRQNNTNAKVVWNNLITSLKNFRSPNNGKWPEAAAISKLNSQKESPNAPEPGFVRSEFGLPIIFHFKNSPPPDATLTPQGSERMASPLILRPLKCIDGNVVGLAAMLEVPPIEDIPLQLQLKSPKTQIPVSGDLYAVDENDLPTTLKGKTRVIEAFIDNLQQ